MESIHQRDTASRAGEMEPACPAGDLSQIKDQDQLIDRVSDRYKRLRQAQTDVVTWVSLIKEPPGETPSKP